MTSTAKPNYGELSSDSSDDSLDNYNKGRMPRLSGEDSSPLPAGTPFGRKSKLLGDPESLARSLKLANEHFEMVNEEPVGG